MDRNAQSPLSLSIGSVKSPYNVRSRPSIGSSRRSLILPGYKQKPSGSKYSISGRSNQSVQILTKTQYNTVENYGQPLPVLVTEALTFPNNTHRYSVKISTIGWAWVVCGRRLLIWQWQDSQGVDNRLSRNRGFSQQCRELTLPQSDLSHKAELVNVFISENNQVPSCIAVSPEGLVRYWPSIAHEGTSVEESADLQGQECDSLIEINPQGFILATTTCSLVLIQPSYTGHYGLTCRLLKTPSGWLGGLGKRMSSLIFGGLQTSQGNESKLIKVVAMPHKNKSWSIWILASHGLQRWLISSEGVEKLVYECDVERIIRDCYCERIFENFSGDPNDLDIWMLDMQPYKSGIMILVAGVNMQSSARLHYAFATLSGQDKSPNQVDLFSPIKHSVFYNEDNESEILGIHFVLNANQAYMYSLKNVISVPAHHANEEFDTIEFLSPGDSILGGTVLNHNALFFTINHGLVIIIPNDFQPGDFGNSSFASEQGSVCDLTPLNMLSTENVFPQTPNAGNLSLYDMDPNEILLKNDDHMSQMKAAFLLFVKKDMSSCQNILRELFPNELTEVDSTLDRMVVGISKDLLSDTPAADPRWTDNHEIGLGSSTSMQIIQQLCDKLKAFNLLIDFLKTTQLWDKLGSVTQRGNVVATNYVLGEFGEKIVAAIELRKIQNEYKPLVDKAISVALKSTQMKRGLTLQDIFFVDIIKVHLVIQALSQYVDDLVHSDASQLQVISAIRDTNIVILAVLQAVLTYRQDNTEMYSPVNHNMKSEYLPWTTAMGKHGLRDTLTNQHAFTLRHAARCCDGSLKSKLYEDLVNLADLILDGRQSHLESTRGTEKYSLLLQQYETQRSELIYPLVEDEQYERAMSLAEKYLDFQMLIKICEKTQNQTRLDEYMEKFKEYDFSNYLFNWYISQKKGGVLLNRFKGKQTALNSFLGEHPTISWIQQAMTGQHEQCFHTLQKLGLQETELVNKKKTMLSLAKMAALCAPDDLSDDMQQLTNALQVIQFQEELPDSVLVAFAYDLDNMPVLTPQEIIQLFISEENISCTEIHFKMALELLRFIEDPLERADLSHVIWIAATRRDPWVYNSDENPLEIALSTMFFRLVNYCFLIGEDIDDFLPPIEQILGAQELGSFGEDRSFQYLLKLGYENVLQTHRIPIK